jgi:hypothetical protein
VPAAFAAVDDPAGGTLRRVVRWRVTEDGLTEPTVVALGFEPTRLDALAAAFGVDGPSVYDVSAPEPDGVVLRLAPPVVAARAAASDPALATGTGVAPPDGSKVLGRRVALARRAAGSGWVVDARRRAR